MKRACLAILPVLVFLLASTLVAGDKKVEGGQSSVSFVVMKDESGKPVRNAAVILHPLQKDGKQARSGFELKTDGDGKTRFDGIPYGRLRIQVVAHGFQTFGEDYSIGQPEQEITIKLKRPQEQYSIYEKHEAATPGKNP